MPRSSSCSIEPGAVLAGGRNLRRWLSPKAELLSIVMEMALKGRRALVTAGAAGIGRVIAETFVKNGARVHVCDVDDKALQEPKRKAPAVAQTLADVADLAQ